MYRHRQLLALRVRNDVCTGDNQAWRNKKACAMVTPLDNVYCAAAEESIKSIA
jgi:hypothetical protein